VTRESGAHTTGRHEEATTHGLVEDFALRFEVDAGGYDALSESETAEIVDTLPPLQRVDAAVRLVRAVLPTRRMG
jgi:hypothetical protein